MTHNIQWTPWTLTQIKADNGESYAALTRDGVLGVRTITATVDLQILAFAVHDLKVDPFAWLDAECVAYVEALKESPQS